MIGKIIYVTRCMKFSKALPDSFGKEAFNFNKLFSGAKERKPRWKRVIQIGRKCNG